MWKKEKVEKAMTTGWSLHVNASDSKIEREGVERKGGRGGSEVVSKAPSSNGLCQCAVSMLGADSCAVQLRKPGSISLSLTGGGAGSFFLPLHAMWTSSSPTLSHTR